MAIAIGLRNLAVICVPFLAIGAYRLTAGAGTLASNAY
jgi:X-X-X-Leu-X-X-Gly heptad repeat protein